MANDVFYNVSSSAEPLIRAQPRFRPLFKNPTLHKSISLNPYLETAPHVRPFLLDFMGGLNR